MKPNQKFKFNFIMKIWLLLLLSILFTRAFAQEKNTNSSTNQVEGVVYDKYTLNRVARTNIINTTSGKSFYNNVKGEFKIDAQMGDKLIFLREEYFPDTVILSNNKVLVISLQRKAIPLREVTIRDTAPNPLKRLMATRKEFSKIYGSDSYDNIFGTSPGGGAGISIDAIWNSLSRSGRNAKHLQGIIQGDYEQNVIDYRFNRSYVGNITKLKDKELADFMIKYRPGYYTVTNASEYEFISYIRNNLKRYLRNKKQNALQPLNPTKIKAN